MTENEAGESSKGRRVEGRRRRPPVRRFLLVGLMLYLALGYLTTAFRRVSTVESERPGISLPRRDRVLLSGVFSVHTGRSHDARGTREQVAAAARSAGLDFVVIGDHPADDRRPDWELWEPSFFDGVFIDGGQELRAPEAGKVLAMGVDSTYRRWEGGMESFFGFLARQRATAMVVHGRGPRESERWEHSRIDGVQGWEVLDVSEFARYRFRGPWAPYHVLTSLVGYPLGLADEALLHLMREGFDTPTVAAYDSLRMQGPLTATAGLNVHPKLAVGPVLIPGYTPFFRTLVSHLAVEAPLPADPMRAQDALGEGIRSGELFISVGDPRAASRFRLVVLAGEEPAATMGGGAPFRPGMALRGGFGGGPVGNLAYRILRNGREWEWVRGPELERALPGPGLWRVEVYRYTARVGDWFFRLRPWIFANPIDLR